MEQLSSTFTFSPTLTSFSIPVSTYISALPSSLSRPQGLGTGALIFSPITNKLLIIQRAASDSRPNLWEIPGGAVDSTDPSILHGLAREVFEETGLVVTHVKSLVVGEDGEKGRAGRVFVTSRGLRVLKLEFDVEVKSVEGVRLDEREHQRWLWVSEEECRRGVMEDGYEIKFTGREQAESILEGFRVRREGK